MFFYLNLENRIADVSALSTPTPIKKSWGSSEGINIWG